MTTHLIPEQQYVGQMNVVGECFCFGAALDGEQLIYLDIAGPATSVEAVWAKLAQGKDCNIVRPDQPSITVRTAEGVLKRLERKIEGISIYHLLLLHEDMLNPAYAELTTTYLFQIEKARTTTLLGTHIQQLVDIAVFPQWYAYLVQQGRVEALLTRCVSYGGAKLWKLTLDKDAWQRVIGRGLSQHAIHLPTP